MSTDKAQIALELMRSYLGKSGWPTPSVADCSRFIGQEWGELDSALMKAGYQSHQYSRNTPVIDDGEARAQVVAELGDLFMMTVTLANLLHVNLYTAMMDRLDRQHTKRVGDLDWVTLERAREGFQELALGTDKLDSMAALCAIIDDEEELEKWRMMLI